MSIGFAVGVKYAEGEPGRGGEHAESAEDVVDGDVPLGEEDFAVVVAGATGCGCGR